MYPVNEPLTPELKPETGVMVGSLQRAAGTYLHSRPAKISMSGRVVVSGVQGTSLRPLLPTASRPFGKRTRDRINPSHLTYLPYASVCTYLTVKKKNRHFIQEFQV